MTLIAELSIPIIIICLSRALASEETTTILPEDFTQIPNSSYSLVDPESKSGGFSVSQSYFLKAEYYMRKSPVFQNYTKQELLSFLNDLEVWEAPELLRKSISYYLAGYDHDGRPVWASEFGKYDFVRVFKEGPRIIPLLEKYSYQFAHRVIKSLHEAQTTSHKEVSQAVLLVDFDGLDLRFLRLTAALEFILRMTRVHREVLMEITGRFIGINANYVARMFFELLKPLMGGMLDRFDVFGPNSAKWMPQLRRLLPLETIPPWYGGRRDFKPLQVY